MSLLHVFDMDGTLLRGSTASLQIAERLGCLPELVRLETAFAAGTLSPAGFATGICRLWSDLTPGIVAEAFDAAPWIGGLTEVMADIADRGEHSVVITMSPDFFAGRLRGMGVQDVVASSLPAPPFGSALPDPTRILSAGDKIAAVERIRAGHRIGLDRCVAYGDSRSDLPLFAALRHTVAVNADDSLRGLARLHYDGDDLRVAYGMARASVTGDAQTVRW